mgnify:CR=1 FL=1
MNSKSFSVTANVALNRTVWRTLGYGDQPSKKEVQELFTTFLDGVGTEVKVALRYTGAPGHYYVSASFTVGQPWWRRAGFGDTTSREEVRSLVTDFVARVSNTYAVSVNISK